MRWFKNRNLIIGGFGCALQNLALMLPVGLLYSFIMHMTLLNTVGVKLTEKSSTFYLSTSVIILCLMFMASFFQYNSTFISAYRQSCVRRINIAERLMKINMKKEAADLEIMNDCSAVEAYQIHFAAPLIGAVISTSLIAIALLIINWKMALSTLWVIPIAFLVIFTEYSSSSFTSIFAKSAHLMLKLGLASTALTGAVLYSQGLLNMPKFILFILAASRMYDPLEVLLQNLAVISPARSGIDRLNRIFNAEN